MKRVMCILLAAMICGAGVEANAQKKKESIWQRIGKKTIEHTLGGNLEGSSSDEAIDEVIDVAVGTGIDVITGRSQNNSSGSLGSGPITSNRHQEADMDLNPNAASIAANLEGVYLDVLTSTGVSNSQQVDIVMEIQHELADQKVSIAFGQAYDEEGNVYKISGKNGSAYSNPIYFNVPTEQKRKFSFSVFGVMKKKVSRFTSITLSYRSSSINESSSAKITLKNIPIRWR